MIADPPSRETDGPMQRQQVSILVEFISLAIKELAPLHPTYRGTAGNLSLVALALKVPRKGRDR